MKKNLIPVLMLLAAAVLWSTSGTLIKMVSLPPLAIAGWRSFVAGVFLLVVCKKAVKISWDRATLGAAASLGAFCICFVCATKLTTAANAIVLQYTASVLVAVLAPYFLNEPTRRLDWITLGLVVVGVCLFFLDDLSADGRLGIFIGILGAVFWAITMIFLRQAKDNSTAWPLSLGNFVAAGLCLPFMFEQMPGTTDVLGIIGLGTISIGAGYAVFSYANKEVQALEAVLICSIEPFINPIWVFLFVGEMPGPAAMAGGMLVLTVVTMRSVTTVIKPARVSNPA